jgi:hypothetical protein
MWLYHGREATDEDVEGFNSFVYVITRLDTGKRYVGKKRLVKKTSRKPLKGKKRKRVSYSSSDWRTYFGSNDELLKDVAELGEENFRREIVGLFTSLSGASYYEAKLQFQHDVILSEEWYNHWIMVKVRTSPAFRADMAVNTPR